MKTVICLNKPVGKTPLEAIELFQTEFPRFQTIKLSYAGRLDPMAEGLLLVLLGDENKNRHHYEALEKTYEFEVLFGIETDTYDILGLPKLIAPYPLNADMLPLVNQYIEKHTGTFNQSFPPFSSKPVRGRPLFYWAREGKVHEITIPTKLVTITSFHALTSRKVTNLMLKPYIVSRIEKVDGNFRQEKIVQSWNKLLTGKPATFSVKKFMLTCSSGTYIRSLANDLGRRLGTGAIALSLKRTGIGPYSMTDAIQI